MTYIFDEYGERHRFDAFCKTVLRYEAINYFRELNRQRNYSIQFISLSQSELKNSIIYFLIYKERFDFLNIIAIIIRDCIAKPAWRLNSLCNFGVIIG